MKILTYHKCPYRISRAKINPLHNNSSYSNSNKQKCLSHFKLSLLLIKMINLHLIYSIRSKDKVYNYNPL